MQRADINKIKDKIAKFKKLDFEFLSDNEIAKAVQNILMNDMYHFQNASYKKGTNFYRIRKLDGHLINELNFQQYSDFWAPPKQFVTKIGRLNKIGEPLLYVSVSDITTPLYEIDIEEGKYFALIKYVAKKDIKVMVIGGEYDYNAMGIYDDKVIQINEIYNNFFREEFSRKVREGQEYLYRISECIAKTYFDLPNVYQDAWCYVSVQDTHGYNACFRPDKAFECLDLQGALICRKLANYGFSPLCYATCPKNENTKFYLLDDNLQMKYFPELENYK